MVGSDWECLGVSGGPRHSQVHPLGLAPRTGGPVPPGVCPGLHHPNHMDPRSEHLWGDEGEPARSMVEYASIYPESLDNGIPTFFSFVQDKVRNYRKSNALQLGETRKRTADRRIKSFD